MKAEHKEYLESIGITNELLERTSQVYEYFSTYLGHKIDDIFVSEFLNQDQSRVFENLWLFNDHFCCEAKQFLTTVDFDVDILKNSIFAYTVKAADLNFMKEEFDNNSRLVLEAKIQSERFLYMKSSKENCKQLALILQKYIKPNSRIS